MNHPEAELLEYWMGYNGHHPDFHEVVNDEPISRIQIGPLDV